MGASYPEHLFSANNEGIPWEVATDAADSKKKMLRKFVGSMCSVRHVYLWGF